jgi:glycosyltransferase involved in cell wall biosynthesis/O-antigen/teichoic acid export membrane protein
LTSVLPDGGPLAPAGIASAGDTAIPLAVEGVLAKSPRATPELIVMASLGVGSVLNYAYTAVLVYLLPARQFALVGAGSSLLLVCGTVASASVPWVLAREIATARGDAARRQAAVSFCLVGTLVEAAASGLVTGIIAASYGNSAVTAALVGSVVAIFTSATAAGYLQGFERFGMIGALKLGEVVIKVVSGIILVEAGFGPAGAILGFGLGSGVVTAVGLAIMRPDLRVLRSSVFNRRLWRAAGGIMAIQGGVALLASLDVIIGSLIIVERARLATYEVAQILTRVPVFIATAMSIIVFPRLVTRRLHGQVTAIRDNLGLWLRVCVPVAVVTATLPSAIVGRLIPAGYGDVSALLVWTSAAGLLVGAVNLISTYFQATEHYRDPCLVLGAGILILAVAAVHGIHTEGIEGLAKAVSIVGAGVSLIFLVLGRNRWPGVTLRLGRSAGVPLLAAAPLAALRDRPVPWVLWATVAVGLPVAVTLLRFRHSVGPEHRPRVLHLGFEDHRRPGSGGGSVRTHEINRRLVGLFDITVVCARYPGSRNRVEDGVRYVHIGLPLGYFPSLLSYFAAIPWALIRYDSDLVVEDFAAPFSSVAVPWLTRRPVVGVVQWLFARDKAAQYHLPFHVVERIGVRSHTELVAVSDDLAAILASRNPTARITVVPNGLPDEAFVHRDRPRRHVVYVGRMDIAQKGLDLLLQAWAEVRDPAARLILAGDGPDEAAVRAMVLDLGLSGRVRFAGRLAPADCFDLLASASVAVMPSRYESFGLVAAEALAVATPVVAFAIPCLRSLVDRETGIAVPAYDRRAFGQAVTSLLADPARARRLGAAGPGRVAPLRWDHLAYAQGDVYRRLMDSGRVIPQY